MEKVSIIVTHWGMNQERSTVMRISLLSLFETAPQAEIIVIDNGETKGDTEWLARQAHNGNITCYIRNRKNMHFAYARNQGLKMATGDYIVIADNDILYKDGWLSDCVNFLETHEGKYLATPILIDPMNLKGKRMVGELDGWILNTRAGSNVFMMRRKDYEVIGDFDIHHIAGSKYCDRFCYLGYVVAVSPEPKAIDMGLRRGYDIKKKIEHTKP